MKILFIVFLVVISIADAAPKKRNEKMSYPKEAIIQSIIDHKQLQPYLHPEIAGRVPLILSDHLIGPDLKLNKFKKRVTIVPDKDVKGAYIRFTVFDCRKDITYTYCNIAFEYPIESVSGATGVWINRDGSYKFEKTDIR
jgi:hypothetical protein